MIKPLASVIMPTYKRPDAVLQAIETVSAQSFTEWELIIVDDNPPNSPERTKTRQAVSEHLNERIRYIEHENNMGACAARNTGAQAAKADIIAFLDDDDLWHEEKLKLQLAQFASDPILGLNICNIVQTYNGRVEHFSFESANDRFFGYFLNRGAGVCCSAIVVRKNVFDAVGGFDVHQQSYQDLDLMLRIAREHKATVLPESLLFYKLANDGITKNSARKVAGINGIIKKFSRELSSPEFKVARQKIFGVLGDHLVLIGRYVNALKAYYEAMKAGNFSLKILVKAALAGLRLKRVFVWFINRNHQRAINVASSS